MDRYLQFSRYPLFRSVIRALRLPIAIPPLLERGQEPWAEQFLRGETAVIGAAAGGALTPFLPPMLEGMGAHVILAAPAADPDPRPDGWRALAFDASGIREPTALGALHAFFHLRLRRLRPGGRVVVLGRPVDNAADPVEAAAAQALDGFCRSLARELGYQGAAVQLVRVEPGAEARLEGVLRFLLSRHSAYVDGQVITVTNRTRADVLPFRLRPLTGKTALVTGAARGIGAAIARTLAREGARVLCLDRPGAELPLAELSRAIAGAGVTLDISAADAPQRIAARLHQDYGGVDIVIHNAGVTRDRTLARMSLADWRAVLAVNLDAVLRLDRALLQGVLRDQSRLVCISSINGIAGHRGQTNYAASKAGLIGYVAALSRQLAPRGMAVNAVAPGFIETPMTAAMPWLGRQFARRLNSFAQGGLPQDVAEAAAWLASPAAVGLSGAVLRVCGQSLVGA